MVADETDDEHKQVHRQAKQPQSVNFSNLLMSVLMEARTLKSVGAFHKKTLFLGMMHFQDEYNYDIKRLEKCSVLYAMP